VTVEGTWGLGRGLAEAEVIPDVWRAGELSPTPGIKRLAAELDPRGGEAWRRLADDQATAPCLDAGTVVELSRLVRRAEQVFGGPVEVEWAVDERRQVWLLQARPWPAARRPSDAELKAADGCVDGLPASGGQAVGRARVVRGAADLTRLGPHDVLVADRLAPGQLAGLIMLAGLVLEAGGTTSHAATLARERGIPAVFSARGATHNITDGAEVLVDGDAGRVFFRRPAAEHVTA
jgi:pyruvate,water dikinase